MTEAIIPSVLEEGLLDRPTPAEANTTMASIGRKRLMHDIIREALQSSAPKRGVKRDSPVGSQQVGALTGFEDLLGSAPNTPDMFNPSLSNDTVSANDGQLVFDEDGNIVLSAATITASTDFGFSGTVVDAMLTGYEFAYKKTRPTKWSPDETDRFYSALEQFGSDLMLVNTFFPSLTSTQIRQKYKAEDRREPLRVAAALQRSKTRQAAIPLECLDALLEI